jgi:sugar transferase (PEP-CTERM/EpsH1 system associated)
MTDPRPLVAHVMYRFDTGGLENGVVNLINHMPAEHYRHAVIALTEVTDFRQRIKRDDVQFISLNKAPGHGFKLYPRLFKLFRELRPAIVHSRNLAALEVQFPAWLAGVPIRIHGEHGRDIGDLDGSNVTLQRVRRFYRPFVTYYLALSRDLAEYLTGIIRVPKNKVLQVYNGVDSIRFHPGQPQQTVAGCPFSRPAHWLLGTVGRMQTVKDQPTLARAFIRALEIEPDAQATVAPSPDRRWPIARRLPTITQRCGGRRTRLAPRRTQRHPRTHAQPGLFCSALAGRRHFQHYS